METLEIILDRVCTELEEYGKRLEKDGKMSAGDLETVNKLIDTKKNILKTWALEEVGGYSQAGDWEAMGRINGRYGDNYERGNSYARRGEHYVRGHYSRAAHRDGRGRYPRDGGDMMEYIEMMMEESDDPREKEIFRRFKRELEKV